MGILGFSTIFSGLFIAKGETIASLNTVGHGEVVFFFVLICSVTWRFSEFINRYCFVFLPFLNRKCWLLPCHFISMILSMFEMVFILLIFFLAMTTQRRHLGQLLVASTPKQVH